MKADTAEAQSCTHLSAVVLLNLAATWLTGWRWMDPSAGLGVAALAVREGWGAWTSGDLCACRSLPKQPQQRHHDDDRQRQDGQGGPPAHPPPRVVAGWSGGRLDMSGSL